jgi:hypothetical protein
VWRLVMQNNIQQRTVALHIAVVLYKSKLSKFDMRAGVDGLAATFAEGRQLDVKRAARVSAGLAARLKSKQ